MATHILSLPDIVFLDIFTYLSCEDILYTFVNLHQSHLIDLLTEYGAFHQICLSSQLSRQQYKFLSNGIWRYDLVRSFVCKEMFSDFLVFLTPCQIFPSLTDLRILYLRIHEGIANFTIAHASTLTHLSVTRSKQASVTDHYQQFLHAILPHLHRLKFLDTDWTSFISIEWNQLGNCLQSLEYLCTFAETMSDVYVLTVNGFLPQLKSLRIYVEKSVTKTISSRLLSISNLFMPNLETFHLLMNRPGKAKQDEEEVYWINIETLASHSIMPRLRQFSFIYTLQKYELIQDIFQSSIFHNGNRHIDIRFAFHAFTTTPIDLYNTFNMCNIGSIDFNKTFVEYPIENQLKYKYTWFTTSWSREMPFWIDSNDIVPPHRVHHLGITKPHILVNSITKLFPDVNELIFECSSSLFMIDSSLALTPLMNLRCLAIYSVVPGLELLLDGTMLPRLESLRGFILPIFLTFVRRANPMKTLDTINHLLILDQLDTEMKCFAFKQWHILFDVLPCLRTVLIQLNNAKCPPIELANLFIHYIKRTIRSPLTLFSCYIDDVDEADIKQHFINYLIDTIDMDCSDVAFYSFNPTRYDMWM